MKKFAKLSIFGLGFMVLILSCNISFSSTITAWGYDGQGQVSNIPTGNDFVDIAATWYAGFALRSDGSITAWGSDACGQVSNAPTGNDFVRNRGHAK